MPINSRILHSWAFMALFFVVATLAFSITLFEISSAIFMTLIVFSIFPSRRELNLKSPFLILIALYFLMNVLSVSQSEYLSASFRGLMKVAKNILLCLSVMAVVDSEDKFKKIFQFMLWVAFLISVDALLQRALGFDLIRQRSMTPYLADVGRLTGPFRHSNDFSAYLTFVIFLFLGILDSVFHFFSMKRALLILAGFVLVTLSLLGTYSRGAWLAVGVTFVLMAFIKKSMWLKSGVILLVVWALFFSSPLIKARVVSLWDPKGGTMAERQELWQESYRMIQKSPVLGLGLNTYARNEPHFKSGKPNIDNQYAHNGYLQIAAETGLLGLLSFLALLFYFLWTALSAFLKTKNEFLKSAGGALVFGIFAFLLHSGTDTNLQSVLLVNTLWMAMGLAMAAKKLT